MPPAPSAQAETATCLPVTFARQRFHFDARRALWWPGESTLVVSDIHIGKGQSFAKFGSLLPPYDAADTLRRLAELIEEYRPRRLLCLGDSFHRRDSLQNLPKPEWHTLKECVAAVPEWIWIAGNHDPDPPEGLGGHVMSGWIHRGICFQHEPGDAGCHSKSSSSRGREEARRETQQNYSSPHRGEVRRGALLDTTQDPPPSHHSKSRPLREQPLLVPYGGRGNDMLVSKKKATVIGHFHPKARLHLHRRRVSHPCFAWNDSLLIMPAFGTFTGGLEVTDKALVGLLGAEMKLACATGQAIARAEKLVFG